MKNEIDFQISSQVQSDVNQKSSKITSVGWSSPSNIAIIKYWGKYDNQIPANPSLSLTLQHCHTKTSIDCFETPSSETEIKFFLDGIPNQVFEEKLKFFIFSLLIEKPFLKNKKLIVRSSNTFPHSTGIASSASGMSAFCLALCSLERFFTQSLVDEESFFREASRLSRLASGSASRSVYGGWVLWGETDWIPESSNDFAIPVKFPLHEDFQNLNDWIILCDSSEKEVSSRTGHSLMKNHPYAPERFKQAKINLKNVLNAMISGDWEKFVFIVEHEALSLHAMMMTSNPWFILMKPQTLRIIQTLKSFRKHNNIKICFTLDAGPNIHLLFPDSETNSVNDLLMSEEYLNLQPNQIKKDKKGEGPLQVIQS